MKAKLLRDFFSRNYYENTWLLFSLYAFVQTAICSAGFHHPDEHFQILEPLGWKLGLYGPGDLAWEFKEQIRPGMQILLGWIIAKGMIGADIYEPFLLTAFLRQVSGLLTWVVMVAYYQKWKLQFDNSTHRRVLLLFTCFLWFLPYLGVRYSSENWGALLFFSGLYCVLFNHPVNRNYWLFTAGLLMGLSFYIRFQMAFAIVGFLAWSLYSKKHTITEYGVLLFGGLTGAVAGTLADYWLYNQWVFTPYNYFFQNIIAGKAASFGTHPAWFYVTAFLGHAVPPISILLLVLLIAGIWKNLRSPYAAVFICFFLAHSAVGHKEMRFMFPMALLLPLLCRYGWRALEQKFTSNYLLFKYLFRMTLGINISLLVLVAVKPAHGREALYKAFYMIHNDNPEQKIVYATKSPFDDGLKINFFNYCKTCFTPVDSSKKEDNYYLYTIRLSDLSKFGNVDARLEYSTAPIVPEPFNIGHWQERTNRVFIWRVTRDLRD
ncbi:MAG TPA: hypothetical protein VEC12_01245 [Bacteroidia bacterium]|nr:hypothetical protein [Bacteroidia bacterium]